MDSTLSDYAGLLRRRWWVLLLCVALGVMAATVVTKHLPNTYKATTEVQVMPTGASDQTKVSGGRTSQDINLDTEAQILTSSTVVAKAKQLLRSPLDPAALAGNVSVTVPPNTSVLDITYSDKTPLAAKTGSHNFAAAYLSERAATATAVVLRQTKTLQAQADNLNKLLKTATSKGVTLPTNSPDRAYALSQQNVLQGQLTDVSNQIATLAAVKVTPGRILNDAPLPTKPTSPNKSLNRIGGAMLGLLIGLFLSWLMERRRTRRQQPADPVATPRRRGSRLFDWLTETPQDSPEPAEAYGPLPERLDFDQLERVR